MNSIHPTIYRASHPCMHACIHPTIHPPIHPFQHARHTSNHPSMHPSIQSSIHHSINYISAIQFLHPSICPCSHANAKPNAGPEYDGLHIFVTTALAHMIGCTCMHGNINTDTHTARHTCRHLHRHMSTKQYRHTEHACIESGRNNKYRKKEREASIYTDIYT